MRYRTKFQIMRIEGVKDFYSSMERRAEEGSEFSIGYFSLVIASTLLATGGLLSNSVAVIVGSMCVAPFLGPSRAVCLGVLYKKWKTAAKGFLKQMIGLLAVGSTVAFIVTLFFSRFIPGVVVTPEITIRMLPTLKDASLAMFIATSSGVAASLALVATPRIVSEPWKELVDAMVGVEIAIALIPPAAVVGIGIAFGRLDIFLYSTWLLMVNLICLDIIGSQPVLYLWGIKPKPLKLEKKIREITEEIIKNGVKSDEASVEVTLYNHEKADVHVKLFAFENSYNAVQSLVERISSEIKRRTGVSNSVRIVVLPVCTHAL